MLVALILEQRRHAPNGTDPGGNLVRRTVLGGMIGAAVCWLSSYFTLSALWSGFGIPTALTSYLMPWAIALGEALALLTRPQRPAGDSTDA